MFHDRLKTLEHTYAIRLGKYQQLQTDITDFDNKLKIGQNNISNLEDICQLYQKASEEARIVYIQQLEALVTEALQAVFGSNIQFVIETIESRGKPEVRFYVDIKQDDQIIHAEPEDAFGGGVVDVISLALRLAVLQLYHDPKLNGPIILDEPGKHVSENYAVQLGGFLKEYVDSFNRQTIMNTHQPFFSAIADNTLSVTLTAGKSIVSEVNELFENKS